MVLSWADQLLPQLLMEQFDTFPIQCRHIEHVHEGVWFRKNNFWQNDSSENLDNFSLIGLQRWCLHWPINSYHSFWWSNFILFLCNVDTLNMCMKEFGSEKIIFEKNDSSENLDNFSLIGLIRANQLLPQLLMEQFDTFLNIFKSHCWIFIKPCKHVYICKTNTLDKKVRARGQFY